MKRQRGRLGLAKGTLAIAHTRSIGKADMVLNDAMPRMEVNPETYEGGRAASC